jgi:CDP-glycerol glycerophosphotransferase (TagB/SpsB family)
MINLIASFISGVLSLLPNKRNRVLFFGATYDKYSDNVKYVYEYYSCHKEIEAIWVTSSTEIYTYLNQKKYGVCLKGSFISFYYLFTSRWYVSGETLVPKMYRLTNLFSKKICVSHGFGPRTVIVADGCIFKSNDALRKAINKYDYFIMPNQYLANTFGQQSLDMNVSKILLGQQPRILNFNKQVSATKALYRIVYAPTWRQNGISAIELLKGLCQSEFDKLNEDLLENECLLTVLSHPLVEDERDSVYSNIEFLSGPLIDATEIIYNSDMLISDYSSLITDACAFNKKIALYVPDYDYYQFEYGMNTFLKFDLIGCEVTKISDVFRIKDTKKQQDVKGYYAKYCNSDENIYQKITNIISEVRK